MKDTSNSLKVNTFKRRFDDLKSESQTHREHCRAIADNMLPQKSKFLYYDAPSSNDTDRSRYNSHIVNGTATQALQRAAQAMFAGFTSPARPWFRIGISDKDLMEYTPVKMWLHTIRDIILDILSRSNFYKCASGVYKELITFSTGCSYCEEDFDNVVKFMQLTCGEYYAGVDAFGRPVCLYRYFSLTARQMVSLFGYENISQHVKDSIDRNRREQRYDIVHAIDLNTSFDEDRADWRGKKWVSVYFEYNAKDDSKDFLRIAGYDTQPFTLPRWDVTGTGAYGDSCPGIDALGDAKQLQAMEKDKLVALARMVDPMLMADSGLKGKLDQLFAGGITFTEASASGQPQIKPIYEINPNFQNLAFELERIERRIQSITYMDVLLAAITNDRTKTATEIAEMHEEKLLQLGPVTESIQTEFHSPIIVRVFDIGQKLGAFPPAPPELVNKELKIEYISMLAQAQKLIGLTSIEQTLGFALNLSQRVPSVLDKINFDEAVDEHANITGISPRIIESDENAAVKREAQAQQAQQAQQLAALEQGAKSAKALSEAGTGKNSVLDMLLGNPAA